jgi:two-component system, OmpR family, KDP operon response regulator KdpE
MVGKKKVLVVDDEPRILRFVTAGLTLDGYAVVSATGGQEALQLAAKEQPDIIILDAVMTPMSGFDVLEKLRAFSQVPVILCTARSFIADEASRKGANAFLSKPFRPEELVGKIEEVLARQSRLEDKHA